MIGQRGLAIERERSRNGATVGSLLVVLAVEAYLTGLVSQNSNVLSWKESVVTPGDSEDVLLLVAVGLCNFFELTANRKRMLLKRSEEERERKRKKCWECQRRRFQ
jgi:hypothetical protein